MSAPRGVSSLELYQQLKQMRNNINVAKDFKSQVEQIDLLYSNDKTGLVSTIVDFMVHASTVVMKIETKNDTLNELLKKWQTTILNNKVNIDIPNGLRALSKENYSERWRSSLLALKVQWGKVKFENQGTFIVPKKMWFLDGASITSESTGALNTKKYFVTINKNKTRLINTDKQSIFIRKPYNSWHDDKVTPFLVQRGTVFNSLVKDAIVQKQSDVIEAIIPLLLKLQAGNDKLAMEGMNPTEEQFKKLKNQITEAMTRFEESGNMGDLIASLRHDVNLEYLIPDLDKIFSPEIVRSTDKNILSSLGLIELQGFSSTRQEAILNPKVLVEEVTDAVLDWAGLLQDVMIDMMERNENAHPKLANNTIRVIPGTIKAFLTDPMKAMLRSMFDRGVVSHQNATEDIAGMDFETQLERHIREDANDITTIMKPPVIQNIEKDLDPEQNDDNNLEDQDKKPETPEADNFNNALLKFYAKYKKVTPIKSSKSGIINTPEELPEEILKLSLGEQLTYFMTYNCAIEYDDKTPEEAHELARNSINLLAKKHLKKRKKKKKNKDDPNYSKVICQNCDATFDYNSVPEISMGAIECPICYATIDQTGKVYSKKELIQAPFDTIDDLPDNVKNVLPVPAQIIWLNVFKSVFEDTSDEERSLRSAWSKVSETYEKVDDKKKWVKKASLEDYKSEMSPYAYKLFIEMYDGALDQGSSHSTAIKTGLIVVEKVCTKNKEGIWVKNKTLTKEKLGNLDRPDFVSQMLELKLQEEKFKLLDKLNKEDK